ncbi:alpha/beta hydrolase [Shewanella sp. CG12_big_fil_rev_8_21_14_0_65_47_15]|uniref:alpha/beta hydrolase n=1 Tax=Shewanella sp. CG12_big_fil_rev_8_21_14_0_65_47_15 TaxID=1975537 RepID=UPI000CC8FB8D|nr:alpha/beta hydrolase [Shewanella sp. CG12_big_fil_rev_8_21_14_0_65_47_15]PIW62099.1 MAG: alpha/beta hydrolase [Shewanella sp. CG12_big_fil_rev_8_21_14_0_65_47_15]
MAQLYLEDGIKQLVSEFIAAGCPSVREQTIEERRQGYINSTVLAGEIEAVFEVRPVSIDGAELMLFKPSAAQDLPVVIYYHGGCFVSGGVETHNQQLRKLANDAGALVIAVTYRLAPEHVYPAAHDDAFHAANVVHQHCHLWGGDKDKITLMGDSAGGHLALVTCLRLKAKGQWLPQKQVLIYPMLDATAKSQSYSDNGEKYIITRDTLLTGFDMYLDWHPRTDAEASPLRSDNLAGLPETHIITAEFDPLVDEGEQLFRNLLDAGVNAHCRRYLGVIHGFFQLAGVSRSARDAMVQITNIVKTP